VIRSHLMSDCFDPNSWIGIFLSNSEPRVYAWSPLPNFRRNPDHSFILIFPSLHLFAIIVSVLIVNYISISGKSNYFEGSALLLVYIILVATFFFVPDSTVKPD
jgi:Ca2+/H+ antiporter